MGAVAVMVEDGEDIDGAAVGADGVRDSAAHDITPWPAGIA